MKWTERLTWGPAPTGIIFAMKRNLSIIFLTLLFLTLMLVPSMEAGARLEHFSPNAAAVDLIEEVNTLRESKGLAPYQVNAVLMAVAQAHAEYIASEGVLSHFSADGKRPYQRALDAGYSVAGDLSSGGVFAENIHSGVDLSMVEVVQFWQGHSSNSSTMLSEEYLDAGAGVAIANGTTYFVLDVGASDGEVVPTSASATGTRPAVTGTGTMIVPNTALANGEIFHVVKKDEALWSIAIAYGVTIEDLKRLNGLATDEIFEGQTLLIKQALTATFTPSPVVTATFGIPSSTPTIPATPTLTTTPTPIPKPPATLTSGGIAVGIIVLVALLAAAVGSLFGRRKRD